MVIPSGEEINLAKEVAILEASFKHASAPITPPHIRYEQDNTFRPTNWLITFPYNFYSRDSERSSLELVRKFAVVNVLYLIFFLREDDVLDEYHLAPTEYRGLLLKMCDAHTLQNLAVGQLLHLAGSDVFSYLFDYEQKYYSALIWEKSRPFVSLESLLEDENLKMLGYKLMPLGLTFAGYCIKTGTVDKIKDCENLLFHYHIAKQLTDDLSDVSEDLVKPDRSCLIAACEQSLGRSDLTIPTITQTLIQSNLHLRIFDVITSHLGKAKEYAKKLDFRFFWEHLNVSEKRILKKYDRWIKQLPST